MVDVCGSDTGKSKATITRYKLVVVEEENRNPLPIVSPNLRYTEGGEEAVLIER